MTVTYQPQIWDVRQSDSPSVQNTLPLLGLDDWPKLLAFMQTHWPEFDLISDHGEERADPSERWWAIGAIEVKEGPSVFQVQFRKDANTYDPGNILAFCSWPGAPTLPDGFDPTVDTIYDTQAIYAFSKGEDSKGFPHGSESGPYKFWLNSDPIEWTDRRVGSDALVGVHWFETHVCCNPVFWPMRKLGATTDAAWLGVFEAGELLYHVPLVPGMPPGSFDTFSGLGYIAPDGAWRWHVPGIKGQPD